MRIEKFRQKGVIWKSVPGIIISSSNKRITDYIGHSEVSQVMYKQFTG